MISPAPTSWPPNRFTPSRWALESRPFLLDEAPFLCAISVLLRLAGAARLGGSGLGTGLAGLRGPGRGLAGADAGDPQLGVLLPVAKPAPVAGLVLVKDHVDLGAADGAEDLGG